VIVLKFGGTSVGDAAAMERAAEITRSRVPRRPVVVVSALSGVTNALLALAEQAAAGQLIGALRGVENLRDRHLKETTALLDAAGADELCAELSALFDELASLAEALSVLGHVTSRSLDAIAALGEMASSRMLAALFTARGLPAMLIDPRSVVITDDSFTRATPRIEAIAAASRRELLPAINQGSIPVLGGFVGSSPSGITTTLGRGGGDYSASLVGAALDAEAIEIWTDVDGMLTADPRVVPAARLIEHIRFDEAAELASFGAKVLHPSTIAPAVRRGIPVFVYNSRRPEGRGTRITTDAPRRAVTAIAGKSGVTLLRVTSSRMLMQHGFLRAFFEIFERQRTAVDVVATSEVSVSVTVDDASHLDSLVVELSALGDVSLQRERAIVAVVGSAIGGDGVTMGCALGALKDIPVQMVSLSANEINLTFVVPEARLADAMRALHAAFFQEATV
jgi:aspartate kinase